MMTTEKERALLQSRATEIFEERYNANLRKIDRLFVYLMIGQWLFAVIIALIYSPYGWEGKTRSIHLHVPLAIILGAVISALPITLVIKQPGAPVTRWTIAIAQILWSALLIHLTGGRIETHFHIFGSLAFLAFYRDWKVLIPATIVVAGDHVVRQVMYPESVYGILSPEMWRFLEHAFWVAFEDLFLVIACVSGVREMKNIATQQAKIELTEQLEREMEIASHIQTAIVPLKPMVPGLEISARMIPASDVGGDYYDVLPIESHASNGTSPGCWIGIGDVAGHGLIAGLVMLQAQSATKALLLHDPNRAPSAVLADVNRLLFENVRHRLGHDEHMTMSLLRYHALDGRLVVAGAHQSIVICRAATGRCERHAAEGTWLGLVDDIRSVTKDRTFELRQGDLLILFTDGITEANANANANGATEQFGLDRLCSEVERLSKRNVDEIRDELFASLARFSSTNEQDDDVTVLVLRHIGLAKTVAAA